MGGAATAGRVVITAAADGSSLSNPGPAGWAWYVDDACWAAGGWPHGTNNMGELMAVLDVLRATRQADEELTLLCDSQYAINVCTKWIPGWKRRGWKKADGKPILNLELIKDLDVELAGRAVRFEWVKGHAGHALNEKADEKARAVATAYRDGTTYDAGPGFAAPPAERAKRGEAPSPLAERAKRDEAPGWSTPSVQRDEAPDLFSDERGLDDVEQVLTREAALLSDRVRSDRAAADALLHDDFVEFGASGRTWTRAAMLSGIGPLLEVPELESLSCVEVSPGTILHTWRARTPESVVNRSSLWLRTPSGWRLRFHQGTPAL